MQGAGQRFSELPSIKIADTLYHSLGAFAKHIVRLGSMSSASPNTELFLEFVSAKGTDIDQSQPVRKENSTHKFDFAALINVANSL